MSDDLFATLDALHRATGGEDDGNLCDNKRNSQYFASSRPMQRVPINFGGDYYGIEENRYDEPAGYESSGMRHTQHVRELSRPSGYVVDESHEPNVFDDDARVLQGRMSPPPSGMANPSQYAYAEPLPRLQSASSERGMQSSPAFKASQRQVQRLAQPTPIQHPTPTEPAPEAQNEPRAAYTTQKSTRRPHAPTLVQGIEILSTHKLPDRFRSVFPFPNFNAVQSKCFATVYEGNDNFVLSSPTGSGKTAVFELAICRVLKGFQTGQFKIVYQAPTKSLCSERVRDWQQKFRPFDIEVAELTGDTDHAQLRNVQSASIIVTTPEKWDSITRKWKDHVKLMNLIKLFLIDEVHMLKEGRGATLEAVVSRMKSIRSNVRFIALSATVPNSEDIAKWLGKDHIDQDNPARQERFGEEFRPVRLQKHVVGYASNSNDFGFESLLESKLPEVIAKFSHRKPMMVFCFTRKSCEKTAHLLARWWSSSESRERYWENPRKPVAVRDNGLKSCITAAVAWHHAGMALEDRHAVENGFLNGDINVICCTSTLAVGVNLPCHFVIIKNTVIYTAQEGIKEYSDLEIMQMLGRAGRPQYDTSAVAVIMTRREKEDKYKQMVSGQEILESCLHKNLIDHLNAEIGLGTVTSLSTAKKWLSSTFLYVRLRENPEHYRLDGDDGNADLDARLENICCRDIELLREHGFIEGESKLTSTPFGDSMARYYVQFQTASSFLSLPDKAKISEILSALANASELHEIRLRGAEKSSYKQLNKSSQIKFPIPVNLDTPAHKVSLIIQSQLAAVELPTDEKNKNNAFQYSLDVHMVFQHINRLIRCIIDFKLYLEDSVSLRNALFLCRSLGAKCWDDSALQLKQIESVGPVGVRKLVTAGIRSLEALEHSDTHKIETALQKNQPFGRKILDSVRAFPKPRVSVELVGKPVVKAGQGAKVNIKAEIGFMNEKPPIAFQGKPVFLIFLAETSDGHVLHFARASARKVNKGETIKFSANLTNPAQIICCHVMCDEFAGTLVSASLKPTIPSVAWPIEKAISKAAGNTKKPAMNISKRRTESPRNADAKDEFGDFGLDDEDLIAAVGGNDSGFQDIDNFDDWPSRTTYKKADQNHATQKSKATQSDWQPTQLSNGNWACNHACKDKQACKHLCCKDGTEKPPKKPKIADASQHVAPVPTQTKSKLQKGQTKLNLTSVTKARAPFSMDDNIETLDLTEEVPKRRELASKTAEMKRLDNLHLATQSGVAPSTLRANLQHTSPTSEGGAEPQLSFLSNTNDRQPSSDYGHGLSDFELPEFSELTRPQHEVGASPTIEGKNSKDPDITAATGSYEFPDDSEMAEVMIGLADSQDLRNARLHEEDAASGFDMDVERNTNEHDETSVTLQPDAPMAKTTGSSLVAETIRVPRNPFVEDSSSPCFGQKQQAKKKTKRSAATSTHTFDEPSPKKRHVAIPASRSNQSTSTKIATKPRAAEASSSPPAKATLQDIDPWILEEFGEFVTFT